MRPAPARVAVLSPQPVVALGLGAVLERSSGRFVAVGLDPREPDPEVALYDAALLDLEDDASLRVLVDTTATCVMVVGSTLRPDLTARALDLGADGFFTLDAGEAEVLAALQSTVTGWHPGDPGENPTVGSGDAARRDLTAGQVGLTDREREVLALIARGRTTDEIAAELYLGVNTVKTYIRSCYARIGATNRAAAVAWAIAHGLPSH